MTEPQTTAEAMEAAALNLEVDAEGRERAPPVPRVTGRVPSPAEWACKRLALYLEAFEDQLDDEHEAAMGFTAGPGGAQGLLRIEGVGFSAPDIVTFSGRDGSGTRSQLLQHVSQLNVVLRAIRRPEGRAPYRIGFRLARALDAEPDAATDTDAMAEEQGDRGA